MEVEVGGWIANQNFVVYYPAPSGLAKVQDHSGIRNFAIHNPNSAIAPCPMPRLASRCYHCWRLVPLPPPTSDL